MRVWDRKARPRSAGAMPSLGDVPNAGAAVAPVGFLFPVKLVIDFLYVSLGGEVRPTPNGGINHHQHDNRSGYTADRTGHPVQNIGDNDEGDSKQAEMRAGLLCQAPPVKFPYHRSRAYNRARHTEQDRLYDNCGLFPAKVIHQFGNDGVKRAVAFYGGYDDCDKLA